jgi:pilus assembly protein CpaC
VTISGYTIPAISTRRAETRVVLNSGQSFAIAGLLDQRTTDQFAKTPGIASVPVLGELFKSKSTVHAHTELIVMVTPTVVEPLKEEVAPPQPLPKLSAPAPLVEPKLPAKLLDMPDFDNSIPKPKKP